MSKILVPGFAEHHRMTTLYMLPQLSLQGQTFACSACYLMEISRTFSSSHFPLLYLFYIHIHISMSRCTDIHAHRQRQYTNIKRCSATYIKTCAHVTRYGHTHTYKSVHKPGHQHLWGNPKSFLDVKENLLACAIFVSPNPRWTWFPFFLLVFRLLIFVLKFNSELSLLCQYTVLLTEDEVLSFIPH
jgi:hypothetical protein